MKKSLNLLVLLLTTIMAGTAAAAPQKECVLVKAVGKLQGEQLTLTVQDVLGGKNGKVDQRSTRQQEFNVKYYKQFKDAKVGQTLCWGSGGD